MSSLSPIIGYQAGLRTGYGTTPRTVFGGSVKGFKPGGGLIDCVKARDVTNTDSQLALRAGLLMGSLTANGRFVNSFGGVTAGAYAATATSLSIGAVGAAELLRRNGATGNLTLIGPAVANTDPVLVTTIPYTAIDTGTGVVTVDGTGTPAAVVGSLWGFADGSQYPDSVINDGFPRAVALTAAGTDVPGGTVAWPDIPDAGELVEDYFLPAVTDLAIIRWLRKTLIGDPTVSGQTAGKTNFTFRRAMNGLG